MSTPKTLRPIRLKPLEWLAIADAVRDEIHRQNRTALSLRLSGQRRLAKASERNARDLTKIWAKLGQGGEIAEHLGTRPGRLTKGSCDPRREYLNLETAARVIASRYEAPVGSWPSDADPEIAASAYLSWCQSYLLRPDIYNLRHFMLDNRRWIAREAVPIPTGSDL